MKTTTLLLIGGAFAAWYFLFGPGKAAASTATTTTNPGNSISGILGTVNSANPGLLTGLGSAASGALSSGLNYIEGSTGTAASGNAPDDDGEGF